jgi:hypothetical protein
LPAAKSGEQDHKCRQRQQHQHGRQGKDTADERWLGRYLLEMAPHAAKAMAGNEGMGVDGSEFSEHGILILVSTHDKPPMNVLELAATGVKNASTTLTAPGSPVYEPEHM